MENKICSKCKQLKLITEFYKHKTNKDGLRGKCKSCMNKDSEEWRQQNLEYEKEYKKKYYQQNLNHCKERNKKYRKANVNKIRKYAKAYYEANRNDETFKEKRRVHNKRWNQRNPDSNKKYRTTHCKYIRDYKHRYFRKKQQEDAQYRLNNAMSTAICHSLKGNKVGRHWEDLINYTIYELRICMEKQWTAGMNWQNYGKDGWVIDHKTPKSIFNFSKPEHIDFKKCWALDNLQPMWADENLHKSTKIDKSFQPSLQL